VQEVYDKGVLHRLVGVQPKTTVTQGTPHLNGIVRSNGGGVIAVQTAWEPTERSQEAEDEEPALKPEPSAKAWSQEVIDVDTEEEESRYGIPRKGQRKINEVMDAAETIFTTDDGSGDSDVIIVESSEEEEEEEDGTKTSMGGLVRIDRKRAFWASKGGTGAGTAGLGT
jgi:non-canonical poly(A) RNA polymerase PAPD5/7